MLFTGTTSYVEERGRNDGRPLRHRCWLYPHRWHVGFQYTYEGDSVEQAEVRRWARSKVESVNKPLESFEASIAFLKLALRTWSNRSKATKPPEGFFRNLQCWLAPPIKAAISCLLFPRTQFSSTVGYDVPFQFQALPFLGRGRARCLARASQTYMGRGH